jgi:hypothetical protein
MSTNVFESQDEHEETPLTIDPLNVNVFADQLSTITNGDGKQKYDTVEKALEALQHSQSFIPTLQSEKTALEAEVVKLREQVAQAKGVQEVVDRLTQQQRGNDEEHQPTSGLNAQDVEKLITQGLTQRTQADTMKANANAVDTALKEKFGTEASKAVAAKAHELGMTPQELGSLAAKSPKMVLSLFGETAKQVGNTTNSFNFAPNKVQTERMQRPTKSLMMGATTRETTDFMKQIKAEVYADLDVTEEI